MKVTVTYPDPEEAVVDVLTALLAAESSTATVAIGVPRDWTPTDPAHVQVRWDGTPSQEPMVALYPVISVIVYAATTAAAKELALRCQGLLLGYTGTVVRNVSAPTGPIPVRDPDTNAELASFTVRVTVRSEVLPVGS